MNLDVPERVGVARESGEHGNVYEKGRHLDVETRSGTFGKSGKLQAEFTGDATPVLVGEE